MSQKEGQRQLVVRQALSASLLTDLASIVLEYAVDAIIEGRCVGFFASHGQDDKLNCPRGLASDGANIYICDRQNNRIQVWRKSGVLVGSFGSPGKKNGQFNCPSFVAHDSSELYVSDFYNLRIQVFSTAGIFRRKFETEFVPNGIAVGNSLCFVSNVNDNAIHVFTKQGKPHRRWQSLGLAVGWGGFGSAHGKLAYPEGLCFDDNEVYVADCDNSRVEVFGMDGRWVRFIGESVVSAPLCVVVHGGMVIVTSKSGEISLFQKRSGEFVKSFKVGQTPIYGVAMDSESMYLTQSAGHRVEIWR